MSYKHEILEKTYTSIDDKHSFNILIIEDTAYFTIYYIDPKNYKTLLLELLNAFKYMCANNIKFIKQYITHTDIKYFKNSTIISYDNNIYIVKTNINDFINEFCTALSINKL